METMTQNEALKFAAGELYRLSFCTTDGERYRAAADKLSDVLCQRRRAAGRRYARKHPISKIYV